MDFKKNADSPVGMLLFCLGGILMIIGVIFTVKGFTIDGSFNKKNELGMILIVLGILIFYLNNRYHK